MKTRTSQAGKVLKAQGFTLFEVLVVLVVIGLATALLPGFVLKGIAPVTLDRAATALADQLREARGQAVFRNQETVFVIDVERRLFHAGDTSRPLKIEEDIALDLVTARSEQTGEASGGIRFFPDGSATGGRVVLSTGGDRRTVEIDWLTGAISVGRDER